MGACALLLVVIGVVGGTLASAGDSVADSPPAGTERALTVRSIVAKTGGQALVRGRAATTRRERQRMRRRARQQAQKPEDVICRVFGRHCRQAVSVAHCESRLRTDAQNGEYLGLFQMGSWARSLYGHGPSAVVQAKAAYRYFVESGRDWSPWGCKP